MTYFFIFIYGSKETEDDLVCNRKETLLKVIKVKKQEKVSPKMKMNSKKLITVAKSRNRVETFTIIRIKRV